MKSNLNILCGVCPNCQKKLFFPEHEASVECTGCGQRQTQAMLKNLQATGLLEAIETLLNRIKQSEASQKEIPNPDNNNVNGLSNYLCAMLSPLLTSYGMDKVTGRAKLLTEMGKSSIFDCGQLADRAFLIDPEHLNVPGYGRDRSGSNEYLRDTLDFIKKCNENDERLVPIHADGDGHCLVHAVSRSLVGWQLFWHPLRMNLLHHFEENFSKYQMQFQDFIDDREWQLIIRECDPDFIPTGAEPTGLRNIHIFGLANVLKRPIILLDSLEGIQSPGDYSAIFLPCFSPPSDCMNKEGVLNSPICIAWSSSGRNHFIPLVGIKGKKCPVLPRFMVQRAWGVADTEINNYVKFDERGCCKVGGEKALQTGYFQRLVAAMSEIFFEMNKISPSLLADVYHHIFKANGLVFGMNIGLLMEKTKASIEEGLLYMCTNCHSLCLADPISEDLCYPGGELYEIAVRVQGKLKDKQLYKFPLHDVTAFYDLSQDRLVIVKGSHKPLNCSYCASTGDFRLVDADYKIHYRNGDKTTTKSKKCCGFKHYYNGLEMDGQPKRLQLSFEWGGRSFSQELDWFEDQEDPSLNSNAYELAQNLVQELFPGEFGSERLVQKIVDLILRQTKIPEESSVGTAARESSPAHEPVTQQDDSQASWQPDVASKAILSGFQHQSVHKEDLNKSDAEKKLKQQIKTNAPKQQRKLSDQIIAERRQSPEAGNQKAKESRSHQSSPSPTASVSSQSSITSPTEPAGSSASPSTNKRIRLSTSDGRTITLDLPSECTYTELQSLIASSVGVMPAHQRIRHGFPPRELKPPIGAESDYKVPIQPGDKILLDININQAESQTKKPSATSGSKKVIHPQPPNKGLSWTSFAEGGMDEVSDRVLQGLMDPLLSSGGDNLDHSLSALALTAALDNKDLWSYVLQRPHLFSVNGLFYKQVERDMGLEHGKHCQLPLLPHKVFVYNRFDDRLELCLEPYGHFPIEGNVEKNASSMLPASKCSSNSPGKAFTGQGHSLRSSTSQEERMPTDIPMSPKRNEARRLNNMCDPASRQESIEEEDEETEKMIEDCPSHRLNPAQIIRNLPLIRGALGAHSLQPEAKMVRKGPGYSELSPIPENTANERMDLLHQWVSRMEKVVETIDKEAKAAEERDQLSPFSKSPLQSPAQVPSSADKQRGASPSQSFSFLESPTSKSSVVHFNSNSSAANDFKIPQLSRPDADLASLSPGSYESNRLSVAAFAEQVAFGISAMDTEAVEHNLSHAQQFSIDPNVSDGLCESINEDGMESEINCSAEPSVASDIIVDEAKESTQNVSDHENTNKPELMDSS